MLFLLAKIVMLMIGSALFGGLYMRWRLTRRYEDVTSEYARMRSEGMAWRHTVDGYLQKIARSSTVDLGPLQQRIERVEDAMRGIVIHKPIPPDLSRVLTAIAAIPRPPPPTPPVEVDLRPVHVRLLAIEQAVRSIQAADASPAPAAPAVDLEPMERRFAALEHAVRTIVIRPTQVVDLEPLLQKLDALAKAMPDAAPVSASASAASYAPSTGASSSDQGAPAVRAGSRNLLTHAGFGRADDLQRLKGVKKVMERMLHDIGVYYFWQIAEWTDEDAEHADAQLAAFHGRIKRDKWVEQAATLSTAVGAAARPAAQ